MEGQSRFHMGMGPALFRAVVLLSVSGTVYVSGSKVGRDSWACLAATITAPGTVFHCYFPLFGKKNYSPIIYKFEIIMKHVNLDRGMFIFKFFYRWHKHRDRNYARD